MREPETLCLRTDLSSVSSLQRCKLTFVSSALRMSW